MHPLNTNISSASASADKFEDDKTKQSQDKAINITEYNYQKYYVNKEKYEKQINEKYQANTRWESIYKECVTRSELRYLYRNIERFDKNFCRLYIEIRPYFEVMFNQSPYDESNWKKYIK